MAYTKYSLTPANNTAAPPDGAPEGMLPSAVNDTMRDMMAQIRDCGDGIRDGTYTMTAPKITGGTITGATFTGNTFSNPIVTGVSTFAAGTVSAPTITTTGDTNTGIFFPAADTIAFTEGGVESMRIDSSGNVGIGTTSPNAKFDVTGGAKATTGIMVYISSQSSGANSKIQYSDGFTYNWTAGATGNNFTVSSGEFGTTAGTERMRITSGGNVGIGITAPTCALDVLGGIKTSRTEVTSPAATDGNIFSGTYTPTLTNTTNVAASTSGQCQYMRVGNVVTVSGQLDIDPTAATSDTILGVSLPIASNINSQRDCGGTFYVLSGTVSWGGSIYGDSANDRATFRMYPADGTNRAFQFTFTYRMI